MDTPVKTENKLHPKELMLWLYLATTAMLFAGFTSAYLVQRFNQSWKTFDIPLIFWVNTLVLGASSLTFIYGYRGLRQENPWQLQVGLMATFGLGMLFLLGQVVGWQMLARNGIFLAGSHRGASYFYVLTALHALHLAAGIIIIGYWMIRALRYKVGISSLLGLRLAGLFWHALDILWLYLVVFLQVNQLL
ncbi:MAG: cytochrome c oxidase subunit 3 [Bacteroidia bacterium]|nr:cytochrome c oxidase subunit 3 [Bacteroidia bacterium]MDW8235848.1 cytochrome c oxidase subunit 3 [Bacteroidia bacterium]